MMKRVMAGLLCMVMLLGLCACGEKAPDTLTIAPHEGQLFVGEELLLRAEGSDQVLWSSSDEAVASVGQDGTVKGLSGGSATIKAELKDNASVFAEAEISVGVHVSGIELDRNEMLLLAGTPKADGALEVRVMPENALIRETKLESSDTGVVTVDPDGRIHAVAPGTATVTVSSLDEAYSEAASCAVTVKQGVSSITLSEEEAILYLGENMTLGAEAGPENAEDTSYTWSSSDESVAKVDQNGSVTAIGKGEATILCTANDGGGAVGECRVKAAVGVQKLSLESNKLTVLVGADNLPAGKIGYTLLPENNSFPELIWESSDESIVKVEKDGTIRGVAPGTATITARTSDPRMSDKVKASCSVTAGNAVRSINVAWGDSSTIGKGKTLKLKAEVSPGDAINPKVAWASSNESVMTVDANGSVRAVGTGKATISCKSTDGTEISSKREFTVIQAVTGLTAVERGTKVIFAGDSTTLHVTAKPDDASDKSVTWMSSDDSVAKVDSTGKVTAKNAGSAVITATTKDGSNRSARFNIVVEPVLPITVDSLGFGVYNANLLGITVKNYCSKTTIKNFDFSIDLYSFDGSKLSSSGSYSLGKDETIGPNATRTIRRTMSGVAWAQKVVIRITGVKLSDGSYYSIPLSAQEVWTFRR